MADDFEAIIGKIMERTGMGRDEMMARIMKKRDELEVVTLEGAARMVGTEMGVNLGTPEKLVEVIAPKWYKIDARELEDGRWQLHYEEGFDPKFYDAFKLSADAMQAVGVLVTLESDRAVFDTTGPKDKIMNMLAGEFFAVSGAGRLTIAEIFALLSIKAAKGGKV